MGGIRRAGRLHVALANQIAYGVFRLVEKILRNDQNAFVADELLKAGKQADFILPAAKLVPVVGRYYRGFRGPPA